MNINNPLEYRLQLVYCIDRCYKRVTCNTLLFYKGLKMDYETTVETIMGLIKEANLADSYLSKDWQRAEDARIYFAHLRNALESIGAIGTFNDWVNNGEYSTLFQDRTLVRK